MADDDVRPSVDRFTWERALKADEATTGTRLLVLLTMATYMDASGDKARPTQAALAADTGLTERAVRKHLATAMSDGWLIRVRRGHRISASVSVSSLYRPGLPQQEPRFRLESDPTGTDMPVGGTQPEPERHPTGTGVPPTIPDQEQPPSRNAVTHEPAAAEKKPQRITPTRIFTEMARRRLAVGRREECVWAPPEGCDPRREKGWLQSQAEAFKAQYGFKLDALLAKHYRPEGGPEKFQDPDWYVWHLDPDLSKLDPTQPTAAETRAKLARERAEHEARLAAMTPEDHEADARARDEARARLAAVRQRKDQDRHLTLVAVEAS